MNIKGSKKKNQVLSVNIFEQQEIIAKAEAIKAELRELSKSAFGFSNTAEGFESMLGWSLPVITGSVWQPGWLQRESVLCRRIHTQ